MLFCPPLGKFEFDSSDHVRFHSGTNISGHNYGCYRRISIENNVNGGDGYTVTIFNMDGMHPLWGNNIQMSPKQMKIVSVNKLSGTKKVVELRGFGFDLMGSPFSNYGMRILIEGNDIEQIDLLLLDRGITLEYYK